MSSRKKRKRLALGRHKSADTRTATDGCTKENTSENDDRPTSHSPIVGVGEHSPEPVCKFISANVDNGWVTRLG